MNSNKPKRLYHDCHGDIIRVVVDLIMADGLVRSTLEFDNFVVNVFPKEQNVVIHSTMFDDYDILSFEQFLSFVTNR